MKGFFIDKILSKYKKMQRMVKIVEKWLMKYIAFFPIYGNIWVGYLKTP